MSQLTTAVPFYVLANAADLDVSPPVVIMFTPKFGPQLANGNWPVEISWLAVDRSDVAHSDFWIRQGLTWYRMGRTTGSSWNANVAPNVKLQFAVRSTDMNGNVSPWVFSAEFS